MKRSDLRKELATELLRDYEAFIAKAKANGFDIRLNMSAPTLKLYFNELCPDALLVDRVASDQYFYDS